jgi:hypothetical protein
MRLVWFLPATGLFSSVTVQGKWALAPPDLYPGLADSLPDGGPMSYPEYMVDNTNNTHGTAPDKRGLPSPDWPYSGSLENYLARLARGEIGGNTTSPGTSTNITSAISERGQKRRRAVSNIAPRAQSYWVETLGPKGKVLTQSYKVASFL